jgi:hypothetical protein
VVAARSTSGEQQLGACHLGAVVDHFRGEPRPDGVEAPQPPKQLGILHLRYCAGEGLKHRVMCIDQARNSPQSGPVDNFVGAFKVVGQFRLRPNPGDKAATDQESSVALFALALVEGCNRIEVLDKECGHHGQREGRNGVSTIRTGMNRGVPMTPLRRSSKFRFRALRRWHGDGLQFPD